MFGPHQKAVRAKGPHPIIFKEQLKLQIFTFHMQCMRQKIISMQFVCRAHLFIRPRPFGEVHWSPVGTNSFRGYMAVLI